MLDEELTSSSSAPVDLHGSSFSKTQKCCKVKLQRRNLPSRRRFLQTWKSSASDATETPGEQRRPEQGWTESRPGARRPPALGSEGRENGSTRVEGRAQTSASVRSIHQLRQNKQEAARAVADKHKRRHVFGTDAHNVLLMLGINTYKTYKNKELPPHAKDPVIDRLTDRSTLAWLTCGPPPRPGCSVSPSAGRRASLPGQSSAGSSSDPGSESRRGRGRGGGSWVGRSGCGGALEVHCRVRMCARVLERKHARHVTSDEF